MRVSDVFLWIGIGALALFGPLVLVLYALDGRKRLHRKSPRLLARAALWSATAIYGVLGGAAFLYARTAPPWAPRGLGHVPLWILAGLCINFVVALWAWWILRDEEGDPDRAMVAQALEEERQEEERRRAAGGAS